MNIQEYSHKALRTLNCLGTYEANLAHMAMGISGEAGEILDAVKKTFAYNKALDKNHVIEEIGDVLFYINGLLDVMEVSWDEALTTNIKKLEARYPAGHFDAQQAINRDVAAEKAAMGHHAV